jgi:hypothetical protein
MDRFLPFAILVLIAFCFKRSVAVQGVDVSSTVLVDTWKCLKSNGYTFGVIRIWQSNGAPDPIGPHTVYNAWDGGMEHVDVYMFPCFSCGDPKGQVQRAVANLKSFNCKYGMLWFDVEGPGTYWSNNQANNANFLQDMITEARSLGQTIGIYTSSSQWIPIMGSWTGGSSYPLWYAHYNGQDNFNDFQPFGGWSRPNIKQFAGNVNVCGANVDRNFYP